MQTALLFDGEPLLDGIVFRRQAEDIRACGEVDLAEVNFVASLFLDGSHQHGVKGIGNTPASEYNVERHPCANGKTVLHE